MIIAFPEKVWGVRTACGIKHKVPSLPCCDKLLRLVHFNYSSWEFLVAISLFKNFLAYLLIIISINLIFIFILCPDVTFSKLKYNHADSPTPTHPLRKKKSEELYTTWKMECTERLLLQRRTQRDCTVDVVEYIENSSGLSAGRSRN